MPGPPSMVYVLPLPPLLCNELDPTHPLGLGPLVGILDIWELSFSLSLENDGLNSLRNYLSVDDIRSLNELCIKSGIEVKLLTFRVKSLKEHHLQAKF